MAVQDYGLVPIGGGLGNTMLAIGNLNAEQQRTDAFTQRNALLERGMENEQAKNAEIEEARLLYPAVKAGNPQAIGAAIEAIGRRNPQAAQVFTQDPSLLVPAMEQVLGIQPEAPPAPIQLQQQDGYKYLEQGGKVLPGSIQQPQRAPLRAVGGAAGGAAPKPEAPVAGPPISPKDANTARVKLTQVRVARNQLNRAKEAFAEIKNSLSAGPGGRFAPTPKGKAFDAAVDSMRGSITSLTRVPGVGAMSDYETRLDQAKFPSRGNYEAVAEQQLTSLETLLDTIEQGYTELLGGKPAQSAEAPAASSYVVGKLYRDAQGREAIYMGKGKDGKDIWQRPR